MRGCLAMYNSSGGGNAWMKIMGIKEPSGKRLKGVTGTTELPAGLVHTEIQLGRLSRKQTTCNFKVLEVILCF